MKGTATLKQCKKCGELKPENAGFKLTGNGECAEFINAVTNSNLPIGIWRELVQRALIKFMLYTWTHKADGNQLIAKALNILNNYSSIGKVETIAFWIKHVGGYLVSYSDNQGYSVKLCKSNYTSVCGVKFTYDKNHNRVMNQKINSFWILASSAVETINSSSDLNENITTRADELYKKLLKRKNYQDICNTCEPSKLNRKGGFKNVVQKRVESLVKDKTIHNYLEANPINNRVGKFGVPQDKFRYGFFGCSTLQYDIWRKGDK